MKLLLTSAGWEKNNTIGKEFIKLVNKNKIIKTTPLQRQILGGLFLFDCKA